MSQTNENNSTLESIKEILQNNKIVLFMKGTPFFPSCRFSGKAVQIIQNYNNINFQYVDILANPEIKADLVKYANWYTFPQLWVNNKLIGGSDVLEELHNANQLKAILEQ